MYIFMSHSISPEVRHECELSNLKTQLPLHLTNGNPDAALHQGIRLFGVESISLMKDLLSSRRGTLCAFMKVSPSSEDWMKESKPLVHVSFFQIPDQQALYRYTVTLHKTISSPLTSPGLLELQAMGNQEETQKLLGVVVAADEANLKALPQVPCAVGYAGDSGEEHQWDGHLLQCCGTGDRHGFSAFASTLCCFPVVMV